MDILLIHQVFVTPDEGGGTRHYEMGKYLVKKGHNITVIASSIDYLTGKFKGKSQEKRDGLEIHYTHAHSDLHKSIFHRALNFFSFAFSSFKKGLFLPAPDVVWGTSPPLFQAFTSLILARIKGAKYIFEVRDLWLDFAKQLGVVTNPFLYKFFKLIERFIYIKSDIVVVNSPGFIPFVKKYVPEEKIKVFPNGVDVSPFEEVTEADVQSMRKKFATDGKFILLYAGNLGVANDIESILSAAELLLDKDPNIHFYFLGGGLNSEKFARVASEKGLSNVHFFQSQPKKDIPAILKIADICLATLRDIHLFNTTYPNKVFDYMAAGKPVLLAIDGAIREVVENAKAGFFVPPGNPAELAKAILMLKNQKKILREMGENGFQYVKTHFDRQIICENFNNFLKEFLHD